MRAKYGFVSCIFGDFVFVYLADLDVGEGGIVKESVVMGVLVGCMVSWENLTICGLVLTMRPC